jgi:hypothetical protein
MKLDLKETWRELVGQIRLIVGIWMERLRKHMKNSVRIDGGPTEIRNVHLPNTNKFLLSFTTWANLPGWTVYIITVVYK